MARACFVRRKGEKLDLCFFHQNEKASDTLSV